MYKFYHLVGRHPLDLAAPARPASITIQRQKITKHTQTRLKAHHHHSSTPHPLHKITPSLLASICHASLDADLVVAGGGAVLDHQDHRQQGRRHHEGNHNDPKDRLAPSRWIVDQSLTEFRTASKGIRACV